MNSLGCCVYVFVRTQIIALGLQMMIGTHSHPFIHLNRASLALGIHASIEHYEVTNLCCSSNTNAEIHLFTCRCSHSSLVVYDGDQKQASKEH